MDKYMILAVLALGVGCDDKGDSVGEGDTDTDTDTDTDADTDPTGAEVTWGTDSVSLELIGGSGSYEWGITQTGAKAWIAEDCVGGTYAGFGPFCKTITGDATTSFDCVDKAGDVTNDNTLFCGVVEDAGNDASLTYYFAAMDDSWCAVDGPDADYYASEGCQGF